MTDWTRIKELGSGVVDFRLMIEGWPHEWVTNYRITHNTNAVGRIVYPGLSYSGLRFSEQSTMREGWPQCSGMTFTIRPTDGIEDTLYGFTRDARPVGVLLANLDADDTTWTTRPAALPAGGPYFIATEAIFHEGSNVIDRGWWDTAGQVHAITEEARTNPVPIYAWPPSMEGRRAYLYVYGAGDDVAGDGNCIWRGVVSRPPRMASDGVSWTIQVDPITTVFEQNVAGGEGNEYRIRGVYHSNQCPMAIAIYTMSPGTTNGPTAKVHGFFESQEQFASAVNSALATAVASATGDASDITSITFSYESGTPYFWVTMSAPGLGFGVGIQVYDALDGDTTRGSPGDPDPNGVDNNVEAGTAKFWCGDSSGNLVSPAWTVKIPWGYPLPAARCMVGQLDVNRGIPNGSLFLDNYTSGDAAGTYPGDRVYMESVAGLVVGMTLCVRNGDDSAFITITDIDDTDGEQWIEVDLVKQNGPLYLSSDSVLVPVADYGTSANWYLFMDAVIDAAPEANLGRTPYITANDVDISTWAFIWGFYPFHSYWRRRTYKFIKATKVRDILAPELMATGFMGRLIEDGRFSVSLLPVITPQRTTQHTLTDDDILYPFDGAWGGFPTWEAQREGLVNIVLLQLGYNPITDEYDPAYDFLARQTTSIAEHKSGDKAKHTISVKSTPSAIVTKLFSLGVGFGFTARTSSIIAAPSAEDIADMVSPYLRTMAEDYAIVTVSVPYTKFGVLCGDIIEVTSVHIPDGLGSRGVTAKKGICIGREWDLDPATNAMGKLTLWFPRDVGKRAGYAPLGRVTAQSNTSGNIWVLTFSTANTFNIAWSESNDGDVVKHYAVSDTVTVISVDSTSPTKVDGTITAKPASNQITVNFGATWTPGGSTWNLRFRLEPAAVARQTAYCYVADDDGALADGSAARSFL